MKNTFKAASAYFATVFAFGFVLGTARVLLIVPRTGKLVAVLIELPVMLAASWLVCRGLVRRWKVPPAAAARITMGLVAFSLLMLTEFTVAFALFSRRPDDFISDLCTAPGALGLVGQICFGLFPLVQGVLEHRRRCR